MVSTSKSTISWYQIYIIIILFIIIVSGQKSHIYIYTVYIFEQDDQ